MKRKGFLMLSLAFTVLFICILATASLGNISFINNAKAEQMRETCNIIDRSLEAWSKSHQAVKEDSIRYQADGKVSYEKRRVYPATLQELKDTGYISREIDSNVYRYSTRNGGLEYHLEVELPNGKKYVSPESKY